MTITAKYDSVCPLCSKAIKAGSQVEWQKGQKARHVRCNDGSGVASTSSAPRSIKLERRGRRTYFHGDTMSVRDLLRSGGAHWDADEKAWWIGSHDAAEKLASEAATAPAQKPPPKRITHCVECGSALDSFQQQRGYTFCSAECRIEKKMGSSWSGRLANGAWHQGSDD